MQTLQKTAHEKKIVTILLLAVFILAIQFFSVRPTLAAISKEFDTFTWNVHLNLIKKILQTASAAIGAVGLAFCGIRYVTGTEQTAQKALTQAIYILIAVIAFILLPTFIRFGIEIGQKIGWNPRSL